MINQIANKLRIGEKNIHVTSVQLLTDGWRLVRATDHHPKTDQTTKAQKLTLPSAEENTSMNG